MLYAYEDMSSEQFEDLVYFVSTRLLGMGVQRFSTGPDGGRDARFSGTAERYPSSSQPWSGTVVIQAKHTNGLNKRFAESDFFGSNSATINTELPRIKSLRTREELDHYMLFSNRRLTAISDEKIRRLIAKEAQMPLSSVCLVGCEQIEGWLKQFPDVAKHVKLDPLDSPLLTSPEEMAEVVEALADQKEMLVERLSTPPANRISYQNKNRVNNMSPEFATLLRKRFLKDTPIVKTFLADPVNQRYVELYDSVSEEFQMKIIAHRQSYRSFDLVYNHLLDTLFGRDVLLRTHKRLTRLVLFYMYWNCDVGLEPDASS